MFDQRLMPWIYDQTDRYVCFEHCLAKKIYCNCADNPCNDHYITISYVTNYIHAVQLFQTFELEKLQESLKFLHKLQRVSRKVSPFD